MLDATSTIFPQKQTLFLCFVLLGLTQICFTPTSQAGDYVAQQTILLPQLISPESMIADKFDQNDTLDIVIVDSGKDGCIDTKIVLLPGNGDATFGTEKVSMLPCQIGPQIKSEPIQIVAGDFNNDGIMDLLAAHLSSSVSLLEGMGNGTFIATTHLAVAESPYELAVGDFNNDKNLDFTVIDADADTFSDSVKIFLGQGNGQFTEKKITSASNIIDIQGIHTLDFNGDQHLDLAVFSTHMKKVLILAGDGQGGFALTDFSFKTGNRPFLVKSADVTGNGSQDFIVSHYRRNAPIEIVTRDAEGDFYFERTKIKTPGLIRDFSLVDLTGNGRLDLVAVNIVDNEVLIYQASDTGSYDDSSPLHLKTGKHPTKVATGQFDQDQYPDFVVLNYGDKSVTSFNNKR